MQSAAPNLSIKNSARKLACFLATAGLVCTSYAKSPASCGQGQPDTDVVYSRSGLSSGICLSDGRYATLRYAVKSREISIELGDKRTVLENIPKGFNPELVDADKNIRILPARLQPYLPQHVVLYLSARRTNGGDGGGQCGAGAEIYLNVLNLNTDKPRLISKNLIASCSESIELDGSETAVTDFNGYSVVNGRLTINFLSYKDKDGMPEAHLSEDLTRLEFR
ncbi:hypothetical protein [Undibacterium sp.]|uniref:hypothetical protein n=1 Tax=Undibacterium sp. TaxID=1914977 RepID=UPI00374D44CB